MKQKKIDYDREKVYFVLIKERNRARSEVSIPSGYEKVSHIITHSNNNFLIQSPLWSERS